MPCKFLTVQGFLIIMHYFQQSSSQINCWNNQKNNCIIAVQLTNLNGHRNDLIQMNCSTLLLDIEVTENSKLFDEKRAILNGCQTTFDYDCCGLELLPNCNGITEIFVQYFQMNVLRIKQCQHNLTHNLTLNVIQFHNNDIGGIDTESFPNTLRELKQLEFHSNSLYYVMPSSFKQLHALQILRILNEIDLSIRERDFLFNINALIIQLESLKLLTAKILEKLPKMLLELIIINTTLDQAEVNIINNGVMHNLTIINCGLEIFILNDNKMSMKLVNIQRNNLKDFKIVSKNNIQILDLSENNLTVIPQIWLKNLTNLKELILMKNHIKLFNLYEILISIPQINIIDLRDNQLNSLQGINGDYDPKQLTQVRLYSSKNPWSCSWLYKFAQQYPAKFRIMTYEKFIRKINVNGLECQIINENVLNSNFETDKNNTLQTHVISSSGNNYNMMLYGGHPVELKRNQRSEALIIIFMLPMGIALLFLLLYMWIYCQKVFHLSYYRNVSCTRRKQNSKTIEDAATSNEADTSEAFSCSNHRIYQLTHNTTQIVNPFHKHKDYEETVNSVRSICT